MAWISGGTTNDEMVDALKRFGVIKSMDVEESLRRVDRKFFVPQSQMHRAHSDEPLKEDHIHISAPHIYGSVLELLDFPPNAPLSVLNAGSGTGYLTCLAASILGPRSTHYCIELHKEVVDHCLESIERWRSSYSAAREIDDIHVIHGDALQIAQNKGEAAFGFDRIYIGAVVDNNALLSFQKLLKPGGILVGPVEDDLIKVVRSCNWEDPSTVAPARSTDFHKEIISRVNFAPLIRGPPNQKVHIPARIWNPSLHKHYPESFHKSCKALMMCTNANLIQPMIVPQPSSQVNVSAALPKAIWLEILSFTHKDWFKSPHAEVEILQQKLKEEQEKSRRANEARLAAEAQCRTAVREREVYRTLARRWQSRLTAESQNRAINQELFDDGGVLDMVAMLQGRFSSIEDLLQHLDGRTMEDSSDDDSESHGDRDDGGNEYTDMGMEQSSHESLGQRNEVSMEDQDSQEMYELMSDDGQLGPERLDSGDFASVTMNLPSTLGNGGMNMAASPSQAIAHRHQPRTVSFSGDE